MPSLAEVRKISLRALHKSATQHWENTNAAGQGKRFQRTASMPAIKSSGVDSQPISRLNRRNTMGIADTEVHDSISSQSESDEDVYSEDTETKPYQSISFGFQTRAVHEVPPKMTDIMEILYNGRMHRFFLLDSRGISSWLPGSDSSDALKRELFFPKYKTKLLRTVIFSKKHNVYFAICSDFTLKVFNKDFHETCKMENKSMRSLLHLIFNPATDELIASGVAGTIVWKYKQAQKSLFDTIKPMANYELQLSGEYPDIGGTWCTKVQLIASMQYLLYCSETDLYAYDAKELKKLFTIRNAHSAALTCVGYSSSNRLLFTGSVDCELKVWGASGGHIYTLRGHSRAISSIVIHPDISGLVFTSSLDGTIKVWSIDTMDLFYSLSVHPEGVNWMNLTEDGLLWCANLRKVTVFKFHPIVKFWGHARCRIVNLEILEHHRKARRLMAVGEDGSVRLFSQAKSDTLAVCTVLPPPVVSLLDNVRDVTHSRSNHLVFVLINQVKLWLYTTKTDPACRIAEWDIPVMLKDGIPFESAEDKPLSTSSIPSIAMRDFEKKKAMHRCTQLITGKTNPSVCNCVLAVFSENGFQFHSPVGICSALSRNILVLGLEDGRLVFADQKRRGLLYCELQGGKGEIVAIKHKAKQSWLITQSSNQNYSTFQIWKLPELEVQHTIEACRTISSFAILDNLLVTGHTSGHINIHSINSEDEETSSGSGMNAERQPEHRGSIIDVKSCRKRGIFCSSSADGIIKIWSDEKILLTEIRLGEELSSCNFLSDQGDLVIGWKRHLYIIDHRTLDLPDLEEEEINEEIEKDSDIYEDPAIKYESALKPKGKASDITMNQYLVPYGFIATENCNNVELKLELMAADGTNVSVKSDETARAPTDTYISPASSMASFGIIDALFPVKSPQSTQRIKQTKDLLLPEFGISPGTTPTESITSIATSEEEYQIIVDDLPQEEQPETPDDEVFQPPWLKKEEIDLEKKLSTGVFVAKAVRKMRKKKEESVPEEPQKSRFAGTHLDSRGLMKGGMNAVFAVETMKQKQKKLSTSSERPSVGRIAVKKRRRPSTASYLRKSLVPAEIPLDPVVGKTDVAAIGDFTAKEVDEIVEKTTAKLKEMGLKMTPHQKVDSAPARRSQMPSSATNFHKSKQGTTRLAVKSGISNKLKRKISKSATPGGSKSSVPRSGHQFNVVTSNAIPGTGTAPLLEPLTRNRVTQLREIKTSGAQSTISADVVGHKVTPAAQVHMKYKRPTMVKEETKQDIPEILPVGGGSDQTLALGHQPSPTEQHQKKENDEQTVSSSTRSDKPSHVFCEEDSKQNPEKNENDRDEIKQTNEQKQDAGYPNIRQLLERCRPGGDDDSGDEDDDFIIPNLLEYDFHAIYKKDGLQFDEKWQDRMLERYLLLKLQKKQRQEAAMSKRIFLEQERHFRLLSSHPDLLQKYKEPWFEDPDVLANYILNSSLMRGDATSPVLPLYSDTRTDSKLSKRPNTTAASTQYHEQDGVSEKESNFRFSIRPKSCDAVPDSMDHSKQIARHGKSSILPPSTPANSSTTLKTKSSTSLQNLMADRPRSSTSIPGKTRYILIRPEKERPLEKVSSPSKLEEQLLRKRFPSQHLSVMKSLGRIDEEKHYIQTKESSMREPGGRASTPINERTIQTAPCMPRKLLHKSETDAFSVDKTSFSGILGNSEHSLKSRNAWKSSFSDVYINPLDIVKRKPSNETSPGKLPMRSIHV